MLDHVSTISDIFRLILEHNLLVEFYSDEDSPIPMFTATLNTNVDGVEITTISDEDMNNLVERLHAHMKAYLNTSV